MPRAAARAFAAAAAALLIASIDQADGRRAVDTLGAEQRAQLRGARMVEGEGGTGAGGEGEEEEDTGLEEGGVKCNEEEVEKEKEEAEKKLGDDVQIAVAVMLMSTVIFVMMLFYLVNHHDLDIKYFSWNIIGSTISIFSAVLIFQSANTFKNEYIHAGLKESRFVNKIDMVHVCRMAVDFVHMLLCFFLLQFTTAVLSGACECLYAYMREGTFCGCAIAGKSRLRSEIESRKKKELKKKNRSKDGQHAGCQVTEAGVTKEVEDVWKKIRRGWRKRNMDCFAILGAHTTAFASILFFVRCFDYTIAHKPHRGPFGILKAFLIIPSAWAVLWLLFKIAHCCRGCCEKRKGHTPKEESYGSTDHRTTKSAASSERHGRRGGGGPAAAGRGAGGGRGARQTSPARSASLGRPVPPAQGAGGRAGTQVKDNKAEAVEDEKRKWKDWECCTKEAQNDVQALVLAYMTIHFFRWWIYKEVPEEGMLSNCVLEAEGWIGILWQVGVLGLSFLGLGYAISSRKEKEEGEADRAVPPSARAESLSVALDAAKAAGGCDGVVATLETELAAARVAVNEEGEEEEEEESLMITYFTMCISWSTLWIFSELMVVIDFWGYDESATGLRVWTLDSIMGGKSSIIGKSVLALVLSVMSFISILFLDKLHDYHWSKGSDEIVEQVMLAEGLLIGFAWEQTFDTAVMAVASRIPGNNPQLYSLIMAGVVVFVVVPAYRMYVMPKSCKVKWKRDTRDAKERQ